MTTTAEVTCPEGGYTLIASNVTTFSVTPTHAVLSKGSKAYGYISVGSSLPSSQTTARYRVSVDEESAGFNLSGSENIYYMPEYGTHKVFVIWN